MNEEKNAIGYDRLKQILVDYVMNDFEAAAETEYVRDILMNICGCTEEEMKELGFGFMIDDEESED